MPTDLRALVAPGHTVLLTMECQRGTIGDLSSLPVLREAAHEQGVVTNGARLCVAARDAGVRVVHCTAEHRRDRAGGVVNCRILAASHKSADHGNGIWAGTPGAEVIPEFRPDERDLVLPRLHGLTPFTGTSLDQIVRNLGATTVVAIGVSLNVGVLGMVLSAVDLGYQVVVPTDAVAAIPAEYGQTLLTNTVSLLATTVTTDELCAAWPPAHAR